MFQIVATLSLAPGQEQREWWLEQQIKLPEILPHKADFGSYLSMESLFYICVPTLEVKKL